MDLRTSEPAASVAPPLVLLDVVTKQYGLARGRGRLTAVDGVSLKITHGESLGLVGESGCGKSTIARLVVGLERADGGAVRIAGVDRSALGVSALKSMRRRVQLVFQDPYGALDPRMRIGTSLEAPLAAHRIGDRRSRRQKIEAMLDAVGLDPGFLDRFPRDCSGGQLQRIVIARALLLDPEVLVCDEPTSALDASIRAQVLNLLVDLRQRFSLTLLMISHDLRVVRFMCENVAVMYLGQIVEFGTSKDVFERPRHPYTKALVTASMIDQTGIHDPAAQLAGEPGSPVNLPPGCRFEPRCRSSGDRCATVRPALDASDTGGLVRCHHWRQRLG